MGWRYLAYRLNGDGTEDLLHPEIPLSNPRITDTLSGPYIISGVIAPENPALKGPDGRLLLREYSTAIYAEADGVIRAGGILTDIDYDNEVAEVTAMGFMAYPDGQGWVDEDSLFYEADPATIYRFAWTRLQSHAGSNLGLQVDAITTPMKIGKRATPGADGAGATSDDPFILAKYATTDLGKDLDDLLSAGNIEAREVHRWDGDTVAHRLELAYPRRGRRVDFRYVIGENILEVPKVRPKADMYASEVVVVGAGEGPAALVERAANATPDRLRRVVALSRQDIATKAQVASYAGQQLKLRSRIHDDVDEFIVRDTQYSPIAALLPGDEVTITGQAGWAGTMDSRFRVISIEYTPGSNSAAVIKVLPTDKAY